MYDENEKFWNTCLNDFLFSYFRSQNPFYHYVYIMTPIYYDTRMYKLLRQCINGKVINKLNLLES